MQQMRLYAGKNRSDLTFTDVRTGQEYREIAPYVRIHFMKDDILRVPL